MSHLQEKSNRKLRFPPRNIIRQSLDSSIIEQVALNLAAITSNLRVSRNREIDCSFANAEGIQSANDLAHPVWYRLSSLTL